MTSLDDIAERLYACALGDFVAERKKAAAGLRGAGDRSGASAVGALAKPSTAAWIINLLVRERGDVVDSLAELGESLRSAQNDLDPAALRTLGEQRRRLVTRVGADAVAVAEQLGQKAGGSIRDEVEQTLQAALADPDAMAAIRTGRLVRALQPAGLDPVDLDGAVAGDGRAPRRSPTRSEASPDTPKDDLADKRRRRKLEEARKALRDAERALDVARERVGDAESARAEAERRREELTAERDDLRARLEEAEAAASTAASVARIASTAAADAREAREEAEDAVNRERSRLSAI